MESLPHMPPPAPHGRRSLKTRLVLNVSGFVAAAMILVTSLVAVLMDGQLSRQMGEMLLVAGKSAQSLLDQRIAYLVETTERLADNKLVVNALVDPQGRDTYLPKLTENFATGRDVKAFSLVDFDGRAVYRMHQEALDYNSSPELRSALAMGKRALFIRPDTDRLIISTPIIFYNTVQGAVVVEFDLASIAGRYGTSDPHIFFKLLHRNREVVSRNFSAGKPYITKAIVSDATVPMLFELKLDLQIGQSEEVYRRAVWEVVRQFLLLGALLTTLALFISAWIGNTVASPILTLYRRVTSGLADGNLDEPLGTNDELEDLAHAFAQRSQALSTAVEHLTESNIELERFAYIASHDLQEPLRNISLYTQLLQRKLGDTLHPDCKEAFGFILDGARRQTQMIHDLLTYSRVNSACEKSRMSLGTACASAIENLQQAIAESHAEVVVHELPEVNGNIVQLTQVFQNLLVNAIKFHRPDTIPRAVVSCDLTGDECIVTITDNGIGVPDTEQDIFEIFRRLNNISSFPGSGIGLTICKRIIVKHGGRIWYDTKLGEGTAFHFSLPALPSQKD